MISNEIRKNIINELAKDGNILNTCRKSGVSPATFYRWKKEDIGFRKRVQQAEQIGRRNMASVAEHALMLKVKDKDLGAIKWFQVHNDPRYRPKPRRVYIEHSNPTQELERRMSNRDREEIDKITEGYKKLTEELRKENDELSRKSNTIRFVDMSIPNKKIMEDTVEEEISSGDDDPDKK